MAEGTSDEQVQQRLAARDHWREEEQARREHIIKATDQRNHVTQQEDARLRDMVQELNNHEPDDDAPAVKKLTDWEMAFLDDVLGFELLYSPKQARKIEDIWQHIFGDA